MKFIICAPQRLGVVSYWFSKHSQFGKGLTAVWRPFERILTSISSNTNQ
jgi:hypothetical protein